MYNYKINIPNKNIISNYENFYNTLLTDYPQTYQQNLLIIYKLSFFDIKKAYKKK